MNINTAFPSNYLKASDLGEYQPVVTIERIEFEPVGREKEIKPVVYFAGKKKGIVLNKTNSRKIAEIAGSPETDNWAGVQIRLYATEVEFSGEQVEAIRIKAPGKPAPKPKLAPIETTTNDDDDDEPIPFAWLLPLMLPMLSLLGS